MYVLYIYDIHNIYIYYIYNIHNIYIHYIYIYIYIFRDVVIDIILLELLYIE